MFEDALMESGGRIKTKSKYFTIIGFVLNGSILTAMILVPLIAWLIGSLIMLVTKKVTGGRGQKAAAQA